eukprot:Gb_00186 [translate_table: standard]
MVLNCCMQILRRVVNPLRLCLAPLCLCLTADDGSAINADPPRLPSDYGSAIDADPPRLPSDEVAQTSLSTHNDYTRLPPVANFDVFINHRGKDVKDTLASHIYDLLQFHGVRAFLDREELPTGEEFPDAITEAIQSSSVHIAIFSPHYAESYWCLRELALMLKTPNATIIPVFYNVTPEELRWAKGAFAAATFDKHYQRCSREMVDEWKAALHEVSNISGSSHSDLKGRLATKVVQEVLKRIKSEPFTVAEFPVGLEEPILKRKQKKRDYKKFGESFFRPRLPDGDQLDDILFPEILSPDSTVIVTSRDSSILNRCNKFLKYEMSGLNLSESKELFCRHAFGSGVTCDSFQNMVDKFVDIYTIKRIWEEESEDSFKLEEDSKDSSTTYDLQILERKCMIQFERECIKLERGPSVLVVTMHEAFRYLGRAIVDEESPTNPGRRSRLWRPRMSRKC